MSLVFITHHTESVYELDDNEEQFDVLRRPKYISKFRTYTKKPLPDIVTLDNSGKKLLNESYISSHRTMGHAITPIDAPCNFLKKNCGVKWERKKNHICPQLPKVGNVTKRSEMQPRPKRSTVNFRVKNIKTVKSAEPRMAEPKYADTRSGDVHLVRKSGLVPCYVHSPTFGKIPKYLTKAPKKLKQCVKGLAGSEDAYEIRAAGIRILSKEDRLELLTGLKKNWLERQKNYQGLPVFTDTQPKKLRKSKMELELRQLEQDILLVESNPVIYICEKDY